VLLALYKAWEELAQSRRDFAAFHEEIMQKAIREHSNLQSKHRLEKIRPIFHNSLADLKKAEPAKFTEFTGYVSFFEILGMYVRNGYIPLRDVYQIYKGPVLDIDVAWREYIGTWQKESHVAKGLLENAIYLMDMTNTRAHRPIYYWTVYRFLRLFY